MATKLEERYLDKHLKLSDRVLELGPGNCAWALSLPESIPIVAIDLYNLRAHTGQGLPPNINYIVGNLASTTEIEGQFDYSVCLSSFEHIGLEQPHFQRNRLDTEEEKIKVAEKLIEYTKPNGRISLTLPGGSGIYASPKESGKLVQIPKIEYERKDIDLANYSHGLEAFSPKTIKAIFDCAATNLNLKVELLEEETEAYIRDMSKDYFEVNAWNWIPRDKISNLERHNYSDQEIILCVTFKRTK